MSKHKQPVYLEHFRSKTPAEREALLREAVDSYLRRLGIADEGEDEGGGEGP